MYDVCKFEYIHNILFIFAATMLMTLLLFLLLFLMINTTSKFIFHFSIVTKIAIIIIMIKFCIIIIFHYTQFN